MSDATVQKRFMQEAIDLAVENVHRGGGPFGAVIVRDEAVIVRAANRVTLDHDPTAHAEIIAIRRACREVGDFQLTGGTLYASCEPCPMCLGAVYWARLERVVYGATRKEAAQAGFDDAHIYDEIVRPPSERAVTMTQVMSEIAGRPFEVWTQHEGRVEY